MRSDNVSHFNDSVRIHFVHVNSSIDKHLELFRVPYKSIECSRTGRTVMPQGTFPKGLSAYASPLCQLLSDRAGLNLLPPRTSARL